jgi:hypothetical protein
MRSFCGGKVMRRTLVLVAAFGSLLCLASALGAQPGGKGGFPGGFGKKKGPEGDGGFGPAFPAPKSTRWEYQVLNTLSIASLGKESFDSGLNQLGADGWELVAVESPGPKGTYAKYIFRRPAGTRPKGEPKPGGAPGPKEKPEARLELRMYQLKNAIAQDVSALLSDVLRASARDPMRVAADPRTNQVVVNATAQLHGEIEALVQRLDVPAAESPLRPPTSKKKFGEFSK